MSIEFFIPHPEIPNHYEVRPGYAVVSSDCKAPYFKWSRIIRKNYLKGHGFLGHYESERIDLRVFERQSEAHPYEQIDSDSVAGQLEQLMVDGTETILHYNELGVVQAVITGIDYGMLSTLSEQYRQYYYEYRV